MIDSDIEVIEAKPVEDTPSQLVPLVFSFKDIYDISDDEITKKSQEIYTNDSRILDIADMESVRVYARCCIILQRLESVMKGPMFQLNSSGLLVPHPIHNIHERERKFFERMSMRLGQNPIARKAILGVKGNRDEIESRESGQDQNDSDNHLDSIAGQMFQ